MTITITATKQIEITTPTYRKWLNSYYRIDEQQCIKVETYPAPTIEAMPANLQSPWDARAEDATELEFYTAYAAARAELNRLANVIDHTLTTTGHD